MILIAHIAGIFNSKIRRAVLARYKILSRIHHWYSQEEKTNDIVVIHASSMGEFEHIKPLIVRLIDRYDIRIVITFFSPSAFESVKSFEGVSFFTYIPFDTMKNWQKLFAIIKPKALLISKHDVWANQIRCAQQLNIPSFLANGTLTKNSGRTMYPARLLLKPVYKALTEIFTISQGDAARFESLFKCSRISVSGDTKFDQVVIRKEQILNADTIPKNWTENIVTIVFGSIWPEDANQIFTTLNKLLSETTTLRLIIVPHQPVIKFLERIQGEFEDHGVCLYSGISNLKDENIILVDVVGVLADLYRYGQIAYVGGSFKQGIHNVMEPAVYKIPVLYGPVHQNSFEARQLHQAGGSIVFKNDIEFQIAIKKLLTDKNYRSYIGENAGNYAEKNTGATNHILKRLDRYLH